MAWLAVDKNGDEYVSDEKPRRFDNIWIINDPWDYDFEDNIVQLPKGSIKKLIDKELTWNNEPVEI